MKGWFEVDNLSEGNEVSLVLAVEVLAIVKNVPGEDEDGAYMEQGCMIIFRNHGGTIASSESYSEVKTKLEDCLKGGWNAAS